MSPDKKTVLASLFGDYRAEWQTDSFAEKFVEPPYFEQLLTNRPCLLIGGRGTGKTTALRSLRHRETPNGGHQLGVYLRMNKNRVRAFQGPDLETDEWARLFAHYFNLLFLKEFCGLLETHAERAGITLTSADIETIAQTVAIDGTESVSRLKTGLTRAITSLELYVNNIAGQPRPTRSMAEAPIRAAAEALERAADDDELRFFCCIDEYENLLDYQQSVLNTYIKHCEPPLVYKVGVRSHGLKTRETREPNDPLRSPEDFVELDISTYEKEFEVFARGVASRRIETVRALGVTEVTSIDDMLPGLSRREEALELGAEEFETGIRRTLSASTRLSSWAQTIPSGDLYIAQYVAEAEGKSVLEVATRFVETPSTWTNVVNNHGIASLLYLTRGKQGTRVRKYYCGTDTFLLLASGNIRYFLELVNQSVETFIGTWREEQPFRIPQRQQTVAAKGVSEQRLNQLEEAERGDELLRLALAIGRVFFARARNPEGLAPEATHFVVATHDPVARAAIEQLLEVGVGHLAFEKMRGTKPTSDHEMRSAEYRLHPIYCPFFEYSYRKKRKITFKAEDLLLVEKNSKAAIRSMLGGADVPASELPDQMELFSTFYDGEAV